MNYANMIEEKGLKVRLQRMFWLSAFGPQLTSAQKGFIVATLISTIVGTFTTSLNFYDRVQDKKNQKKQQGVDDGQNKQIQELNEKLDKLQTAGDKSDSRSDSQSRSRDRRRRRRKSVGYENEEDFRRSAGRSRAMIEREFDENYMRLGQKYAQGDVITENKLQAQIIVLQQAVINVLQEAMMDGRSLSKADIHRLIAAQNMARDGSIEALRGQYDRLLPEDPQNRPRIEGPPQNTSLQRQLTLPAPEREDFAPPKRVMSLPAPVSNNELYCRYSKDLQNSRAYLDSAFTASSTCRCPDCGVRIAVSKQDFWTFEVRTPVGEDRLETRTYEMDARLVIKSHTPYGDFACVLCSRERDLDCICKSVDGLVEHLGRFHTSAEFERERDMHRV